MFLAASLPVSASLGAVQYIRETSSSTDTECRLTGYGRVTEAIPHLWATPSPFLCYSSNSKIIVGNPLTKTAFVTRCGPRTQVLRDRKLAFLTRTGFLANGRDLLVVQSMNGNRET